MGVRVRITWAEWGRQGLAVKRGVTGFDTGGIDPFLGEHGQTQEIFG